METETVPPSAASGRLFRRRGKIVLSLLAVLALVGLAPLGSVAWKLIDVNRELLATAQQEYQLLLASSVAHGVDGRMFGLNEALLRVAQTLGAAVPDEAGIVPRSEVTTVLEDIAEPPVQYVQFGYAGPDGGGAITAGSLPAPLAPLLDASLATALQSLSLGAGQTSEPSVAVSEPMIVAGPRPRALIALSAPVLSAGRLRGVLSAVVDVQVLWDLETERVRTGHQSFAIDEGGRILASSDPARFPPGTDASRSALAERFLSGQGRAQETMPYQDGSERFLGSYAATGDGWGVFVRAHEGDVYRPVQEMVESTVTWALAALVLAAIVALVFARSLSGPINRLAEASRAFARGEFERRVAVRSRNEIGELAHTFNLMAEEIERQIARLSAAAEENHELFLGTIRALAQAIDAKDPYTRGHSVRVNRYAVAVARQLGLSDKELRDIHVASLLHDVGKIGIHDSVLNKPGKLTPGEFELMKTHPVLGANIMEPIRQMRDILPGLRWHHERWKGGGYPDGLAGEAIPLMARVIAVADTFDAITTTRPYQKTMSLDEAFAVINRLKGEALDERVVEAFYRAWQAGQIRLERRSGPVREPAPAVSAS